MADASAESSPATVETLSGSELLASLSAEDRHKWRETGEWPEASAPKGESEPKSAESAPAEPAEQAASTDAKDVKPVSEPAKPHKNAETRKAELDADIQSRLQRRRELDAEIADRERRLRTQPATPAESRPHPVAADPNDPKPDPAKYAEAQFDPAFLEDMAAWKARQIVNQMRDEDRRAAAAERGMQTQRTRLETFNQRVMAAAKADAKLLESLSPEVMGLAPVSNMTPEERQHAGPLNALADLFLDCDTPELALRYFSEQPDELARFARIATPQALHVEWGKVLAKLEMPVRQAEPITKPSAPEPPFTLGRRATEPTDDVTSAIRRGDQRAYRDAMNRREAAHA